MRLLVLVTFLCVMSFGWGAFSGVPSFSDNLVDAADMGDKEEVIKLLNSGYSPDSKGDFGVTPLMRASFRGYNDIAELLIKSGAYVDASDIGGATALHLAARSGNSEMVKLLLYYDARMDVPDSQKWTPLMRAIMSKNEETTKVLVDEGADLNATNEVGKSALVLASIADKPSILKILLGSKGFDSIPEEEKVASIKVAEKRGNKTISQMISSTMDYFEKKDISNKDYTQKSFDNKVSDLDSERKFTQGDEGIKIPIPTPYKEVVDKNNESSADASSDNAPSVDPVEKLEKLVDGDSGSWGFDKGDSPFSEKKLALKDDSKLNSATAPIPLYKPKPKYKTGSNSSSSYQGEFYTIQIGSYSSKEQAEFAWNGFKGKNYDIFSNMNPSLLHVDSSVNGDAFYRLRVGLYDKKAAAQNFCNKMKKRKIECFVVNQSSDQVPFGKSSDTTVSDVDKRVSDVDKSNYFRIVPNASMISPYSVVPPSFGVGRSNESTELPLESQPIDSNPDIVPTTKPVDEKKKADEWVDPNSYLYAKNPVPAYLKPVAEDTPVEVTPVEVTPVEVTPVEDAPVEDAPVEDALVNNYPAESGVIKESLVFEKAGTESYPVESTSIEEELPWLNNASSKITTPYHEPDVGHTRDVLYSEQKQKAEHDYSSFYKDVKESYPQLDKVSEAVLVKESDELPWLNDSGPKDKDEEGLWIAISPFPNNISASDYADRMFNYDEDLEDITVKLSGGDSPYDTKIKIKVGPIDNYTKAEMLCDSVKSGGLLCNISGAPVKRGNQAHNIIQEKQYTPKIKKESEPSASMPAMSNAVYWINLGAFSDYSKAEYYWAFLQEDNNDVIKNASYKISTFASKNGTNPNSVKLKIGPFSVKYKADSLCSMLRLRSVGCLVQ